jgi:hypothetical protein
VPCVDGSVPLIIFEITALYTMKFKAPQKIVRLMDAFCHNSYLPACSKFASLENV